MPPSYICCIEAKYIQVTSKFAKPTKLLYNISKFTQPSISKYKNILKPFWNGKFPTEHTSPLMFLLFSFPSCLMFDVAAILSHFPLNGTLLDKSTYFQLYLPNELWQISPGPAEMYVQGRILLLRQLQDGLHCQEQKEHRIQIKQYCSRLWNK